jgi:hypothetical protein
MNIWLHNILGTIHDLRRVKVPVTGAHFETPDDLEFFMFAVIKTFITVISASTGDKCVN